MPVGGEIKITVAVTAEDGIKTSYYMVYIRRDVPKTEAWASTRQLLCSTSDAPVAKSGKTTQRIQQ